MCTRHTITSVIAASIAIALFVNAASAQQTITVNIDENGIGTIVGPGGGTQPLVPTFGIDPTSGMATLFYNLRGNPFIDGRPILQGDVLLAEIPGTPPSDLLRWTDDGRLFVYSDRPEPGEIPDLADVGLPPNRLSPLLGLQETGAEGGLNGLFGYTPTPNQPGFVGPAGGGTFVTYNFTSDTPEPASLGALGLGGIALLRRHRQTR